MSNELVNIIVAIAIVGIVFLTWRMDRKLEAVLNGEIEPKKDPTKGK